MTEDIPKPSQEYLYRLNAVLASSTKKSDQGQSVNLVKTREEITAAIDTNRRVNVCYTCPKNYTDGRKTDISYFAGINPTSGEPVFIAMEPPVFPYEKTIPGPQCSDCEKIDEIDVAMAHRNLEKMVHE